MRLLAFSMKGQAALGLRVGEEVIDLTAQGLPNTLEDFLRAGEAASDAAKRAQQQSTHRYPLAELTHRPPLARPDKAIAVGLNYRDHASESKFEAPTYPVLFQRFPSSWVAHREPMELPSLSSQFDYEGELVVVIGRGGRYIERARALEHVAGYSIFNDGSVRDYQFKSTQWMMGKNFDRSGSFGSEFVTADEVPAGATGLTFQTRVNSAILQNANTRDMIFDVATLIAVCSNVMALSVGDMIISGTPGGVGVARQPPIFLKAGDVCEVAIEGIGVLSNPIVKENHIYANT